MGGSLTPHLKQGPWPGVSGFRSWPPQWSGRADPNNLLQPQETAETPFPETGLRQKQRQPPAPTPCYPASTDQAYNQLQQCNPTSKPQLLGMATSQTHIPSIGLIANKFLTPEGRLWPWAPLTTPGGSFQTPVPSPESSLLPLSPEQCLNEDTHFLGFLGFLGKGGLRFNGSDWALGFCIPSKCLVPRMLLLSMSQTPKPAGSAGLPPPGYLSNLLHLLPSPDSALPLQCPRQTPSTPGRLAHPAGVLCLPCS